MIRKLFVFGFLALFLFSLLTIAVLPTLAQSQSDDRVPGQVLVKFKDNTPPAVVDAELKKQNGRVVDQIEGINTLVVNVSNASLDKVIEAFSKNPNVEYVESNFIAYALDFPPIPNDPDFAPNQWGLQNTGQVIAGVAGTNDADIDAPEAWNITTGNFVKVAVLDTGIDQTHPDLSSKIDLNENFTGSSTVDDFYGHGTHVAGIVAALTNNGTGVAGVCPECRLLNGKVLNDSGSGAYSWIANGIIWATDSGAKVINMSLGGSQKSATLESAVNYAWSQGVVVVAAAGNSANPSKTYPGAYNNVVAVAATTNKDLKASFSSYGSWVSIAAPGQNIFSTFPMDPYTINKNLGYDFGSGTSMATPMVSGVAALIWSTPHGSSASAVRSRLEGTADKIPGTGSYWIHGRINAGAAVATVSTTPTPTPTPSPTPIPGDTVSVNSVNYSTSGGRNADKHLSSTINLIDNTGNPVSGASLSMTLRNSTTGQSWNGSGTTGTDGGITFTLASAPSGTYETSVISITAGSLTWDGITPPNSFTK